MDTNIKSETSDQRLVCVDALRGFDMLWIIGGAEVLINLCKASGNCYKNLLLILIFWRRNHVKFY